MKPTKATTKEFKPIVGYVTDKKLVKAKGRTNKTDDAKEWIKTAFKVLPNHDNYCGNIRVCFDKKGNALLGRYKEELVQSYDQISSALALYRAISLFEITTLHNESADFYKVNWQVFLKHEKTGCVLVLGEWKGGFQIFTSAGDLRELPEEFIKDVQAFLTVFVSADLTIGYDGTRAGKMA